MSGILEGLKVIEMGHFVAAPAAGAMLADWGADVIKIEPIDGEAFRGFKNLLLALTGSSTNWRFEVVNRNKRSIALDLTTEKGRDILYKLIESTDIFLTNYEASVLNKLKVDYDTFNQVNPEIIYAMATGYGTKGPDKDERGFDFAAAWARTGIQHLIGQPGGIPPQQRGGMMDRTTGAYMVAGVLAALRHRDKTGQGQEIEFSLYHSGIWTISADYQVALAGQPIVQNNRHTALNPLWNSYCCQDGRWLQLAMLQSDLSWPGFCKAIDRPELEHDPKFDDLVNRGANNEELIKLIDEILATRDRKEWEVRLIENDCIYGRVETPEDVINDPQTEANGIFQEVDHPEIGPVKFVTTPVTFKQNPAEVRTTSPEVGQHTEEILLDLGYSWEEISEFKDDKTIID